MGRYVAQICGGNVRRDRITAGILEAVSRDGEPGPSPAVAVKRAARTAVYGQLAQRARRPAQRLQRLWSRHWGCPAIPGLLHQRAAGVSSEHDLDRLYRHLDACNQCARLAGRCDAAEWHLDLELAAAPAAASRNGRQPGIRRPPLPTRAREPVGPRLTAAPPPDALALWRQSTGREAPPPERRAPPRVVLAGVVVVAGLAGGTAVVFGRGAHVHRPAAPAAAVPAAAAAPAAAAVTHGLRDPFVVGGARYAVFRDPAQGWTGFLRTDPGRGRKWLAVTVRVRNLSMAGFDPQVLEYRVLDGSGTAYAPDPTLGTGPALARPATPLAGGQLLEVRLAFRLTRAAAGLTLRFTPVPGGAPIVVALGP